MGQDDTEGTIGGVTPEEQAGSPHYSNSKMNPDLECDKTTPEGTIGGAGLKSKRGTRTTQYAQSTPHRHG